MVISRMTILMVNVDAVHMAMDLYTPIKLEDVGGYLMVSLMTVYGLMLQHRRMVRNAQLNAV